MKGTVVLTLTKEFMFEVEGNTYSDLIDNAIKLLPNNLNYDDLDYEIIETDED